MCLSASARGKGIHMSRLHLALNKLVSASVIKTASMIYSRKWLTLRKVLSNAKIELSFDLLLKKPALLSGEIGFRLTLWFAAERHEPIEL